MWCVGPSRSTSGRRVQLGGVARMDCRSMASWRSCMRREAVVSGVVWILGFVVGCSGGGSANGHSSKDVLDGDGRKAYVAAFEAAGRGALVAGDMVKERRCVVGAVVDGVGVEKLKEAASARDIAEAATGKGQA